MPLAIFVESLTRIIVTLRRGGYFAGGSVQSLPMPIAASNIGGLKKYEQGKDTQEP